MKDHLWQYVMSINPFVKKEEVESIEELNDWDLLITFHDGRRILFDINTGCHQNVFYEDITELTEEQERRNFSYRLRSMMERNGYTEEDLAKAIGVSRVMICKYITGKAAPSIFVLRRMTKIFKCSMDDFFYKNY